MNIKEVTFFLMYICYITNYANLLFKSHDMEKNTSQLADLDTNIYDVWVTIEPH
jgi:hypothetical protein